MAVIPKEKLHLQPVAKGISLARKIDFPDARDTFGSRMLTPGEIDKFAKKHPWRFKLIMRKIGIMSKSICLVSDAPLCSSVKDGYLRAESKCWNEVHRLSIPERSLLGAGIDLKRQNPFLLINEGYALESDGKTFTLTIDPAYEGTLRQCFSLFSHNGSKPLLGWFKNIEGVPVPSGSLPASKEKGKLFCFERDDSKLDADLPSPSGSIRMGLVRRGAGLCDGGRHSVSIAGAYLGARGALVKDEGASALAACKSTLVQTWRYLKEVARGEWGRA